MPEYLSPGVYVEEISTGPTPIAGVGTSTAGFVGQMERGPTSIRLVTSWVDYVRWFGGPIDPAISYLPFAVKGFFDNGGQRAFIARVHRSDAPPEAELPLATTTAQFLRVIASGRGEWGNRLFVRVDNAKGDNPNQRRRFRLTVLYYTTLPPLPLVNPLDSRYIAEQNRRDPDVVEDYDNLGIDPLGPDYVLNIVNSASQLIQLRWTDDEAPPSLPQILGFTQLQGGGDGNIDIRIGADMYLGAPGGRVPVATTDRRGLAGLEIIDEIALLCVPDHVHPAITNANEILTATVNQCERLKDRFAVLSGDRTGDVSNMPKPGDSSYAAVYYPWIRVFNPRTRDTLLIPPAGHVAGIIARTDIERGVHKAPANEVVRGIVEQDLNGQRKPVEFQITKGQHDILNPRGINVIRDFRSDGRGIRVWGARTLSSDPQWKYVNVRRLFLFVEESIDGDPMGRFRAE